MSDNQQGLYKSLENLDEFYNVMVDAYHRGDVLHYCLKCCSTFLTIEEKNEHDEIHTSQSNSECS